MSYPSIEELFGSNVIDSQETISFPVFELYRVGNRGLLLLEPYTLIAIHEMIVRSYVGHIEDTLGRTIADSSGVVSYDYATFYDEFNLVALGKTIEHNGIHWGYYWRFANPIPNLIPLPITLPLIVIHSGFCHISKEVMGYPTNSLEFLQSFYQYLLLSSSSCINNLGNGLLSIVIEDMYMLDLDLIEGGQNG